MRTAIDHLLFIPRIFGEPLYPSGFPVNPQFHCFESKSVLDIYYQDETYTPDQLQFLSEYLAYYLYAPRWKYSADLQRVRQQALEIKTEEDLEKCLDKCLLVGIDPF